MKPPLGTNRRELGRPAPAWASAAIAIVCGATLLATSPGLPMVWDEGNAIWRARGIQRWAELLVTGRAGDGRVGLLSPDSIAEYWRYTTRIEGHPAFYGIVIAAGRSVSERWLGPLHGSRLGPIVLFAVAAGAMFYRMAREYSTPDAVGAVAALMLLPRLFAHAHFASFDGTLTSCWILAWATFAAARVSWRGAVLFGIALGMTLSCKVTGWIAPLPFLVWMLFYRDRPAAKALAIGVPVALIAFFLFNPPLWHDPVGGWIRFFAMNFDRGEFNISTQFFGRMHNLDHPLPWYNTLVWTGITVPVGILLLAGVGLAAACRGLREHPAGTLVVANWLVLVVVRALPVAPPHDGVRLFLPSFAFVAALAGVGAASVMGFRAGSASADSKPSRLAVAGVVLLYAGSGGSLAWYSPQWLSYYNLAIGGLPGAASAGMEPTYYWDGLDRGVLDWLDRHTGPDEKVRFGAASVENLVLMRRWGMLPVEFRSEAPGRYRWYVVQHRPSGWQRADRWLIEKAEPAYRKTIRQGGVGPWRLDVPIVEVYDHAQYERAREATGHRAARRVGEE